MNVVNLKFERFMHELRGSDVRSLKLERFMLSSKAMVSIDMNAVERMERRIAEINAKLGDS